MARKRTRKANGNGKAMGSGNGRPASTEAVKAILRPSNPPPARLRPRHREIMFMLVRGMPQKEISRRLKLSQPRLSIIVNSPLFKRELAKLESDVREQFIKQKASTEERLVGLQGDAVDTLETLMKNKSTAPRLKRDVAKDVLQLSGFGPSERQRDDGLSDFARFVQESFAAAERRMREKQEELKLGGSSKSDGLKQEGVVGPRVIDVEATSHGAGESPDKT